MNMLVMSQQFLTLMLGMFDVNNIHSHSVASKGFSLQNQFHFIHDVKLLLIKTQDRKICTHRHHYVTVVIIVVIFTHFVSNHAGSTKVLDHLQFGLKAFPAPDHQIPVLMAVMEILTVVTIKTLQSRVKQVCINFKWSLLCTYLPLK